MSEFEQNLGKVVINGLTRRQVIEKMLADPRPGLRGEENGPQFEHDKTKSGSETHSNKLMNLIHFQRFDTMKFLLASFLAIAVVSAQAQPKTATIYVGTYSQRGSEGVYILSFDTKTGELKQTGTGKNDKSPSFLALHPNGKTLYTANEATDAGGKRTSAAAAYTRDPKTGALRFLNEKPTFGQNSCHVSIDKTGRWAVISNYSGGNLVVYGLNADGSLGAVADTISYTGTGANAKRQESSHVHSATFSSDGRFLYVANLGTDKVYCYELNTQTGKLRPLSIPSVSVQPGAGPRHFALHPNGRFAYLVEELISSVATFSRDPKTGILTLIQEAVPGLPADFTAQNTSADIHVSPDGKFVYSSQRGLNALSIFAIGPDGKLTPAGHQPVLGETPRNFLIDPSGAFVLVANQTSDNITVFRRDAKTGKLTDTGHSVKVPAPVCVIWGD